MLRRLKIVSATFIALFTFSSVVSASPSAESVIPLDTTVPEGYRVIQEYDTTDENTKVDMQVEGKSLMSETKNLDSPYSISTIDNTDFEILNNETHLYRELQNIETGDIVPQYKTDMVVAADPFQYSGTNTNPNKTIKLTITLYYHKIEKNSFVWLGMDKAYWRFDKGSQYTTNIIPYLSHTCEMVQVGPGITGPSQNQKLNCSPTAGDLSFGKTYLAKAPSNWVEVLDEGLATSMGLKVSGRFLEQSTGKAFTYGWSLTFDGKGPW